VFRRLFLQPLTIGVVPHGGYNCRENQSITAIKWLKWVSESQKIRIRHKLNGAEVKVGPYKVDGMDESTKTIYEFYGCYWHGCRICMTKRSEKTLTNVQTAEQAFQATIVRRKFLENKGYIVVEKWECELQKELHVIHIYFKYVNIIQSL